MLVQTTPRLVLWDIDKTLTDSGGIGRELFAAAFKVVTGRDLEHLPDMAGRTDHDIVVATLQLHEVVDPESHLSAFYGALAQATEARKPDMKGQGRCLPGAREAIQELAKAPGVVQTVVTGNIRPIAEAKLQAFELAGPIDFEIGGYGSDASDRAMLVHLALQRATNKYAIAYPPDRVFVIGDTPHDIDGAKANGVMAIGVTSGDSTADELNAAGADAVLVSLEDTQALLQLMD